MNKKQPEALRLVEMLTAEEWPGNVTIVSYARECVAELRRQHARIAELESQLAQRFDAADMATASAQGFRDGVASVSAGSEPVAKGLSDPIDALRWGANVAETLLSIGRAIGFGRAQQILGEQWEAAHDCAPRGRMGVTVGKCNPPKLWTQRSQDAYRRGWNDYAAAHPSPPEGMAGWQPIETAPKDGQAILVTDAELKALWQLHAADIGGIFYYARAVLAKLGQPAQAAEPVARKQLTRERVKEIVRGAGYDQCGIPDTERAAFINGLRHGEREHGIGETP